MTSFRYDTFPSVYIVGYSFELLVHKPSKKRSGLKAAEIIIMQDLWFLQQCLMIRIVLGYDAMLVG